jgi:cytidyltransferase-like protein
LRVLAKKDWGAKIVSLDEFAKLRPKLKNVVATSGGFDPIHPGHISCIIESKKYGDKLVVVVNGDQFLAAKKGKPFQNLETRSLIVSGVVGVDYVIPFEIEGDQTVVKALDAIKPDIFTKGGDRNQRTLPPAETEACERNSIKVVFGVGESKKWSSSWFLEDWENNRRKIKRAQRAQKIKETLDKYLMPKENT